MKRGDRVRCIDPGMQNGLIKGAIYTVLHLSDQLLHVVRDDGLRCTGYPDRFEIVLSPSKEKTLYYLRQCRDIYVTSRKEHRDISELIEQMERE